jgi:hypothetical protein
LCARTRIRTRWLPAITQHDSCDFGGPAGGEGEHAPGDVRAEVLTPDKLNAVVFGGFAAVALLISVVGVAGVLAFSVSGRTREFGVRIALGAHAAQHFDDCAVARALAIAGIGVGTGVVVGFAFARGLAGTWRRFISRECCRLWRRQW